MISAQVSLYPVEAQDPDAVIMGAIDAARTHESVSCEVGPVSTEMTGEPDEVWQSLRSMFEHAVREGGEVSMVATITNAQP